MRVDYLLRAGPPALPHMLVGSLMLVKKLGYTVHVSARRVAVLGLLSGVGLYAGPPRHPEWWVPPPSFVLPST